MQKIEFLANEENTIFDLILKYKPNLNYQILNQLLRKKDIRLNGKKISKNQIAKNGDNITLFLPEKNTKKLQIVFENNDVLIIVKPQGMEVTKQDKVFEHSECVEDIFEGCYACHRLDKNTEGLLVLAKNINTRDIMYDMFKNHKIKKFYKAIAFGKINKNGEYFVDYHKKENNKIFISSKKQDGATKILTNYNVLQTQNKLSVLDIEILTGKTHQIRAQLAYHKIYILGDDKYGQKETNKLYKQKKQLLCAYKLVFKDVPKQLDDLKNKEFEIKPTFLKKYDF